MASKRRLRRKQESTCSRKKSYEKEADAWTVYNKMKRQNPTVVGIGPYRCPSCSNFHLGHTPKKVRQAIVARRSLKD